MLGFVNGLAIVIFLAQLSQFKVPGTAEAAGPRHGRRRMAVGHAAGHRCWGWWC